MPTVPAQIVTFHMTVTDTYDGAMRVLADTQRFGFDLVSLDLQAGRNAGDHEADITLALSVAEELDPRLLAARFNRHPVVLRVRAESDADRAGDRDAADAADDIAA